MPPPRFLRAKDAAIADGPPGQANVIAFSGGAETFTQAYGGIKNRSGVGNVTYYTPGTDGWAVGDLATSPYGSNLAVFGTGFINNLAAIQTSWGDLQTAIAHTSSHNLMDQMNLVAAPAGPKCQTKIFLPKNQRALGGSLSGAGCEFGKVGHWVDRENGEASEYVVTGIMWTCPSSTAFLPKK